MKNYLIQFLTKGPCHGLGVVVLLLPFINRADEAIRQTTGVSALQLPGKTILFYLKPTERLLEYIVSLNILHKSQIGFLPNNRTADHVFTLLTLIDKYVHNHNEKIYACFVDFKKAFDSVWHDGLWNKLLQIDFGGSFYNLIKSLYHNSFCSIKIAQNQTRSFRYARGVRQGCILSPMLFNLYINDLPFAFENKLSDPFVFPNGTKLNSLLYADDLIILLRSKTGLRSYYEIASINYLYSVLHGPDENQSQKNQKLWFFGNVREKMLIFTFS